MFNKAGIQLKGILILIFLMAAAIALGVEPEKGNNKPAWEIEDALKFQFCYLPDDNVPTGKKITFPAALFSPEYEPDISGMNLSRLLSLGFDVPAQANPKECRFYFKLYLFPEGIKSKNITNKCIMDFGLNVSPHYDILKKYFEDKNNLVVKFAVIGRSNEKFTKENPFPQFEATDTPEFNKYFESHIPYYSLHLKPFPGKREFLTESEAVAFSRAGVRGFHNELIAGYKKNFRELGGLKNSDFYYFLNENFKNRGTSLIIIQIPKKIISSDNWKDFSMPQDPKHLFLTSLLLVRSTEYILKDNVSYRHNSNIPKVGGEEFNKTFRKGKAEMLEVVSVMDLTEMTIKNDKKHNEEIK